MKYLSILLPLKHKSQLVNDFMDRVVNNATNLKDIEVVAAINIGDTETRAKLESYKDRVDIEIVEVDMGYGRHGLHLYVNPIALKAQGELIWFMCDDVFIESKGFDEKLREVAIKNAGKVRVIHTDGSGGALPIVTKKWIQTTGRWANHGACDSWINTVAQNLPNEVVINLESVRISDMGSLLLVGDKHFKPTPTKDYTPRVWGSNEVMMECLEDSIKLTGAL